MRPISALPLVHLGADAKYLPASPCHIIFLIYQLPQLRKLFKALYAKNMLIFLLPREKFPMETIL
jgi:hypothetical protein